MEKTPIEGASRVAVAREPEGTWTTGGRREGDVEYRSGECELQCVFLLDLKKAYQGERCQKNHRGSTSNKLAPT